MGNTSSVESTITPRISPETASKGIPLKLSASFAKRASLTLQCLLSDPTSDRVFVIHVPPNAYYDVILYDGQDATCPVLATAKGNPKWKQDFLINLPALSEDGDTREELLRCTTVNKLKEGYWFAMQIGDRVERFEWRLSRDYPNAWNKKSPKSGFICLRVDNSTPAFDATWNWDKNIEDIHSFPYVRFNHADLPIRLSNLSSIRLSTKWIYTPGSPGQIPRDFSSSKWAENKAELASTGVQANAAWDFFLDDDRNRTLYPQAAAIEFMVWLGRVGDPWWLGRKENSVLSKVTLGETEFSLFYGKNSGGTHVFTAVTQDNRDILSFDEDFYPLFQYILEQARKKVDDLPKDPWLGIVEFGTETWLSNGNVTFTAANFGMRINGNETEHKRNSTKHDKGNKDKGHKGKGHKAGDEKGEKNSTKPKSKGDEVDGAMRLMSSSVYVMMAALVISAVLS
ncbi:hypothetical protein F53441_5730 [Fusarium austroafricanum]|uniref:Uncharacterized protein n=1 Tax=Fusarium austroafricanum TaxID=2364996 RepID=A0A8H4KKH0_9HYPO|nr:hypothetical protein F53441_5730 [Fusarium austroafricanum]